MNRYKFLILAYAICFFTTSIGQVKTKTKNFSNKKVKAVTPMMGWASWNNYRVHINEDIIKAQADAMVKLGLDTLGYKYINIDDGFFGGRDECGELKAHPKRFPSGMYNLSQYIHSKGLRAGIYTDAGINTCASHYDRDTIGVGMGLYGHDRKDLTRLLVDWDYDFIKVDWCGGDWLGLDDKSRYTQIASIIKEIKPEVKLNVCRWKFPGEWVANIAESWRISGDIGNEFGSILSIIDQNAVLWRHSSSGRYNDMDMLQVGRGMSYEEDKTHFSMWCMMNSPLMLGNDLTKMDKKTLSIISNKDLIDINQNSFSFQARKIVDNGDVEIYGRPLFSTASGTVAIAILNRSGEKNSVKFDLKKIGINSNEGYSVKDLWTKKEIINQNSDSVSYDLKPHSIVVILVKGKALPFNIFELNKD